MRRGSRLPPSRAACLGRIKSPRDLKEVDTLVGTLGQRQQAQAQEKKAGREGRGRFPARRVRKNRKGKKKP